MKTLRCRNSGYLSGELVKPRSNKIRGYELAHPKVKKTRLIRQSGRAITGSGNN